MYIVTNKSIRPVTHWAFSYLPVPLCGWRVEMNRVRKNAAFVEITPQIITVSYLPESYIYHISKQILKWQKLQRYLQWKGLNQPLN